MVVMVCNGARLQLGLASWISCTMKNPDTMQVADEAGLELERQEILAAQVPNAAIAMAVFDGFFCCSIYVRGRNQ